MGIVTYAQNFEDVMLWRALKHVEKGFYVDIGAQDPIVDSVSLAFYEHGWRGVHVEPTQQYANKLRAARPDEVVLQMAVGSGQGEVTFYELADTGLSTADSAIAQSHIDTGFAHVQTVVPLISMDTLFEQIGNREIHWLKLDVEGLEKSVLESWVASRSRPWILVVESTKPMTQEQTYEDWEALLLQKQYQFVYFDGLNRFYVSTEHAELVLAFLSPPNVFDGFVLSGQATHSYYRLVETKAQQAEAKAQQAEAKAQQAESASLHWQQQAHQWHERVLALHASTSWKITKPLRAFKRILGGDFLIFSRIVAAGALTIKRWLRHAVAASVRFVLSRSMLRSVLSPLLKSIPWLHKRLLHVAMNIQATRQPVEEMQIPTMSLRARQIYAHLKAAIEQYQKRNC
ncbi:FkbM family methyltransferase [Desulfobulbus elongatus]|uniref:FkbM family methyltransferase n=1 Tax=Desulfobulbus elongatus TaxID=53332 RepID=UPI00068762CA|nr:FkbM family methyltransferase [Desulfobulbus elongatus]